MSNRSLPPFDADTDSDGCSCLAFLPGGAFRKRAQRRFIKWTFGNDWQEAVAACERHDRAYYLGGSRADKTTADLEFEAAWLAIEPPGWLRQAATWLAYRAVSTFGGPEHRRAGVSWSFGGGLFSYTAEPAEEEG